MSTAPAGPERDFAARLCDALPPEERELVVPLLRFRIWEKAQPGSRPVDQNFWPWFREKLRADPEERAKVLGRLELHSAHVAELKAIRERQALEARPNTALESERAKALEAEREKGREKLLADAERARARRGR